jgi:fatty-acyl-CoA synthase
MYGATEGNVALQNAEGRVGSVGKPHPLLEENVRLARFDLTRGELVRGPDGRCVACAPDEAGELLGRVVAGGAGMEYDGYTDRDASARKLVHDAFAPGDAWFRSGDLLRQDATAGTTSSTGSATRSAGRARTSPRRRSRTS